MNAWRPAGYGRRLTAVACWFLLLAGLGLVGFGLRDQHSAPQVPLTSSAVTQRERGRVPTTVLSTSRTGRSDLSASATPSATSAGSATTPDKGPTSGPVPKPVAVSIPKIDVRSLLNPLGVDDQGRLAVPARGPHYDQAAWFTGSPRPGQVGPAVLEGHIDGPGAKPSVFFRLAALRSGDRVTVSRADGTQVAFAVYRVERYRKNDFPTIAVYGDTAGPELRLITCGGPWDPAIGHYRDNTVVYARLTPRG